LSNQIWRTCHEISRLLTPMWQQGVFPSNDSPETDPDKFHSNSYGKCPIWGLYESTSNLIIPILDFLFSPAPLSFAHNDLFLQYNKLHIFQTWTWHDNKRRYLRKDLFDCLRLNCMHGAKGNYKVKYWLRDRQGRRFNKNSLKTCLDLESV